MDDRVFDEKIGFHDYFLLLFSDIIRLYMSQLYVTVCVNCCACDVFYCPFLCPLEHFCRIYSAFELQCINNLKRRTVRASL